MPGSARYVQAFCSGVTLPRAYGFRTAVCPVRMTAAPQTASDAGSGSYDLQQGEVAVRFVNTPSGTDIIAAADVGDGLLKVGDSVGVNIPRACVSGLCGSCTCDIVDPNFDEGFQTVRACQTVVVAPEGSSEMIVDVARMRDVKTRMKSDPMSRFQNLDTDYKAGAAPKPLKSWKREIDCVTCAAFGDVECYGCDGTGNSIEEPENVCVLCSGTGYLRCADCQGLGTRTMM